MPQRFINSSTCGSTAKVLAKATVAVAHQKAEMGSDRQSPEAALTQKFFHPLPNLGLWRNSNQSNVLMDGHV